MTQRRVLVTGLTTQHIGRDPRLKYDHLTKMYAQAIQNVGFEVEHRAVTPEEDLTKFDAIMVGMGPVNGIGSRYTYGAFDAITRARSSNAALLFFCDDWQVQLITSAAGTMTRGPERFVRPMLAGARVDYDWAVDNLDRLMLGVSAVFEREWPTTIIPAYEGGDSSKFIYKGVNKLPTRKLVPVDPTSYSRTYEVVQPDDYQKWGAWVLGTLSDQKKWVDSLRLKWPLAYHGAKASKSEAGALPEAELVQLYANSWGVLSPPYWHAGSGWWRLRHAHAVQAGSIMLGGSGEMDFFGDAYQIKTSDVESMNVIQLRELADAQRDAFNARVWNKEQFETAMYETLTAEIANM